MRARTGREVQRAGWNCSYAGPSPSSLFSAGAKTVDAWSMLTVLSIAKHRKFVILFAMRGNSSNGSLASVAMRICDFWLLEASIFPGDSRHE